MDSSLGPVVSYELVQEIEIDYTRPVVILGPLKAGINISLYLPARAGEQFQKVGISGEEFLKFSCKMLHFVNTKRRKDELNE